MEHALRNMNIPFLLFAAVWLTLRVVVTPVSGATQDYSNSANVESVTTFYDCSATSNALIPTDQKGNVCNKDNPGDPITVIRFVARPGENDVAADRAMEFFTFPQPFANMPVNQQNGDPPNNPCAQANAFSNCSAFTDGDDKTGPIAVQVTVSNVVRKYYLKPVLGMLTVPYSYVNYDAKVPRIANGGFCENGCDTQSDASCNIGSDGNTDTSFYASCQVQNDFEPHGCTKNKQSGSIYSQANSLYDYGDNCGTWDSSIVSNFGGSYGSYESGSDDCRSCSKVYTKWLKANVANWGNYNTTEAVDDAQHAAGCPSDSGKPDYMPLTEQAYPRMMPDICPVAVSHSAAYPVTEGARNSMAHGNPDAYEMEPYYYWCQSMCIGTRSYTPKTVEVANEADITSTCGPTVGQFNGGASGYQAADGKNYRLSERGTAGTRIQDHMYHFQEAYECALRGDSCPTLVWASSMDGQGLPCCNSTTTDPYGDNTNTCGNGLAPENKCGGMAAEQVRNAASYFTAACDATESGELAQCGTTCTNDLTIAANDLSWKCPGWPYDYIRPKVVTDPLTDNDDIGIATAKCSGECQADPYIRWSESGDKQCKLSDTSCVTSLQSITSQKASIGMAGASCRVYQVVPEPIVDVSMVVTITAPDGSITTTELTTDGIGPSQTTVSVQGVKFTTRINEIFVAGGAGPQIPGYIVACGLDEPPQDSTTCESPQLNGGFAGIGPYNPYDPDVGADDKDISVKKPEEDTNFCKSGAAGGIMRGIFPTYDETGVNDIASPTKNPWPQLVRKMIQDRTASGANTAGEEKYGATATFTDEGLACHAPTPRYLGVLNCGKPAYWYYVAPERKTSYGTGFGQVGIQNSFPLTEAGRRLMCLQEDNSATPGYGIPKFTASNAAFFRTPCQELGDLIRSTTVKYDSDGKPLLCDSGAVPVGLQIPGFNYVEGDYSTDKPAYSKVPNTWMHGKFLYQEMTSSEQQGIKFDMSLYTDTYFGGNLQTYAPGSLSEDTDATNICVAVANSQVGTLSVIVTNPSQNAGGTYSVTAVCVNSATGAALAPSSVATGGSMVAVAGSATVTGIDLAAGKSTTVTWDIYASGNAPPPPPPPTPGTTPTPTPTPTPGDTDGDIGLFPNCVVTLNHGGGDNAELDVLKIACSVYALQILANDKVTVIEDAIIFHETCRDWALIVRPFCFIGNEGPYFTFMVIFLLVISFVLMAWVSVLLGRMYYYQAMVGPKFERFKEEYARHEKYKADRERTKQAQLIKTVLQTGKGQYADTQDARHRQMHV